MATVTGLTAARMLEIEDASIISGEINGSGHLILTTHGGDEIDAGYVIDSVPDASETVKGIVELATQAEAAAGSSADRAVTPASLAPIFSGLDSRLDAHDGNVASLDSRLDALEAVTPAQVGITGEIRMWPVAAAPSGWMLCEGGAISRTTYSALYTLLGNNYGAGDGSTTFNVPDLRGRVPVGFNGSDTDFNSRGKTGGEKTHILTTSEMPSHNHTQDQHNHAANNGGNFITDSGSGPGANYGLQNGTFYNFRTSFTQLATPTNQAAGGGGAHNNLQPYQVVKFIIKL